MQRNWATSMIVVTLVPETSITHAAIPLSSDADSAPTCKVGYKRPEALPSVKCPPPATNALSWPWGRL